MKVFKKFKKCLIRFEYYDIAHSANITFYKGYIGIIFKKTNKQQGHIDLQASSGSGDSSCSSDGLRGGGCGHN